MSLSELDLPELSMPATRKQVNDLGQEAISFCRQPEHAVTLPMCAAAFAVSFGTEDGTEIRVLAGRNADLAIIEDVIFDDEVRLQRETVTKLPNQGLRKDKYMYASIKTKYRMVDPFRNKVGLVTFDTVSGLPWLKKVRSEREVTRLDRAIGQATFTLEDFKRLKEAFANFTPGLVLSRGNEAARGRR